MQRKIILAALVVLMAIGGVFAYQQSQKQKLAIPQEYATEEENIPPTPVPQGAAGTAAAPAAVIENAANAEIKSSDNETPAATLDLPPLGAPPLVFGEGAYQTSGVGEVVLNDRVYGNQNAKVTIIEYASLTCPHCAKFHLEVLPQIKSKYLDTGAARLVFRPFPFDKVALAATKLAYCAPDAQFSGMMETLFRSQESWARAANPEEELKKIGKLAGLTDEKINGCLTDEKLSNAIMRGRLLAERDVGIASTPTFVIHGEKIQGVKDFAEFDHVLSRLLGVKNQ